jgi:hypothetical protein
MSVEILNSSSSSSTLSSIHMKSDDRLLKINTLNNHSLYLKYKKGTKTFDDIKSFLFDDFKYACDGICDPTAFDFNFDNIRLSQILEPLEQLEPINVAESSTVSESTNVSESSTVLQSGGSAEASDKSNNKVRSTRDKLSSDLLDIISSSKINLNLVFDHNRLLDSNKRINQLEYNKIAHLFGDIHAKTVYVKTLNGKTICFKCDLDKLSVRDLKIAVCYKENIQIDQMRIIFSGKQLADNQFLVADNKVTNDSTLHLTLRLRGGMFNEVSGRNGNYEPLQDIFYDLDSGFEINLKPKLEASSLNCCKNISVEL